MQDLNAIMKNNLLSDLFGQKYSRVLIVANTKEEHITDDCDILAGMSGPENMLWNAVKKSIIEYTLKEDSHCKTGYQGNCYYQSFTYQTTVDKQGSEISIFDYPVVCGISEVTPSSGNSSYKYSIKNKNAKKGSISTNFTYHKFMTECIGRSLVHYLGYSGDKLKYITTGNSAKKMFYKYLNRFFFALYENDDEKDKESKTVSIINHFRFKQFEFMKTCYENIEQDLLSDDDEVNGNYVLHLYETEIKIDLCTLLQLLAVNDYDPFYIQEGSSRDAERKKLMDKFIIGGLCSSFAGCGCLNAHENLYSVFKQSKLSPLYKDKYLLLNGSSYYKRYNNDDLSCSLFKGGLFKTNLSSPEFLVSTVVDPIGYELVHGDFSLSDFNGSYELFLTQTHDVGCLRYLVLSISHYVSVGLKKITYYTNYIIRDLLSEFCSFLDMVLLFVETSDEKFEYFSCLSKKYLNIDKVVSIIMKDGLDMALIFCIMITIMSQGFIESWVFDYLKSANTNFNFFTGRFDLDAVFNLLMDKKFLSLYLLNNFNVLKSLFGLARGYFPIYHVDYISIYNKKSIKINGDFHYKSNDFGIFIDTYEFLGLSILQSYFKTLNVSSVNLSSLIIEDSDLETCDPDLIAYWLSGLHNSVVVKNDL
jgi:hypothetical protein